MESRPGEQDRADVYALLSSLLSSPDAALLEALALVPPPPQPQTEFGQAWAALVAAAARCGPAALGEHALLFPAGSAGGPGIEDDLGALCQAMALLVSQQRPAAMQRAFFADHLAGRYGRWLERIDDAPGIHFYGAVARLARAFLAGEEAAFAMELAAAPTVAPIRTRKPASTP